MNYLIDTHTLIWFLNGGDQLGTNGRLLMEDEANELLVSIASLWEVAIKLSIGKLSLGQPFEEFFNEQLERNSIKILNITIDHLKVARDLPFYHRDPFDRLIIAQAHVESLPIISVDAIFDSYGIKRE